MEKIPRSILLSLEKVRAALAAQKSSLLFPSLFSLYSGTILSNNGCNGLVHLFLRHRHHGFI